MVKKRDYMLEIKDMTEEENRKYLNYDANLLYKYKCKVGMVRIMIKECGLQVYLSQEKQEKSLLCIPLDERREIYRFMEKNPNYNEMQLVRELFRESEYYPG